MKKLRKINCKYKNNFEYIIININLLLLISLFVNNSFQTKLLKGVFNIIWNNYYLYYDKNKIFLNNSFKYPYSFFRIINIPKKDYYQIEIIDLNKKLCYFENKKITLTNSAIKKNIKYTFWNFIKKNNNNYIIRNINNCYIKIVNYNIICDKINLEEASIFRLIKIYEEVEENDLDNKLIENEPIDVLIKYIDLRDPDLKRNNLHQIEKDYENEELKYCIRSILKNIPWVRKIFILMPNNKVRFFKGYNLIKKKIIYIKDKDLLGYDSSNINAFQFRYWKLKKFGISDNFISMDDDYFIGNKLEKKDFFYVEHDKVVPAIVTSKFLKLDKKSIEKNYYLYKYKAETSKEEQNLDIFYYCQYLTYLLIFDSLDNLTSNYNKESIFTPEFTHNALPVNIKDLKEIYDIVYNSKYRETTLNILYRSYEFVQFQTLLITYTFIKYNRKISHISYKYIQIDNAILSNYKYSLFCINKGSLNYSYLDYYKAKLAMNFLFPIPTPYEINNNNNNNILNIYFNVVFSMDKLIKKNEKDLKLINKKNNLWLGAFKFEKI